MDKADKLKLLKTLRLLDQIPEQNLESLAEFLNPVTFKDGEVVFEERSAGDSLFFISSGHVRISKKISEKVDKDLAILGPGDCFGEMAMIEDSPRSATASASGETVLFQLGRQDLNRWLKSRPEMAMEFFAEMVQEQSRRLRRTSNELALIFDLSTLFLENVPTEQEFLTRVVGHILPHLQGSWSGAASLYNVFNEEMDSVSRQGEFNFDSVASRLPAALETKSAWLDDQTFYAPLPGEKRPLGYLLFHSQHVPSGEDRNDIGRTLATVGRLVASALGNIQHRSEELLRARLKASQTYGSKL